MDALNQRVEAHWLSWRKLCTAAACICAEENGLDVAVSLWLQPVLSLLLKQVNAPVHSQLMDSRLEAI